MRLHCGAGKVNSGCHCNEQQSLAHNIMLGQHSISLTVCDTLWHGHLGRQWHELWFATDSASGRPFRLCLAKKEPAVTVPMCLCPTGPRAPPTCTTACRQVWRRHRPQPCSRSRPASAQWVSHARSQSRASRGPCHPLPHSALQVPQGRCRMQYMAAVAACSSRRLAAMAAASLLCVPVR